MNLTTKDLDGITKPKMSLSQQKKNPPLGNPARKYQYESIDFSKNLEFTSSLGETEQQIPNSIAELRYDSQDMTPVRIVAPLVKKGNGNSNNNNKIRALTSSQSNLQNLFEFEEHQRESPLSKCEGSTFYSPVMLYQIWPGNNSFYFNGKMMAGPKNDRFSNMFAWVMILLSGSIFFVLAAPYLWNNISVLLPLLNMYLFILTIIFFVLTTFTEPGIIPRKAILEISRPKSFFLLNEDTPRIHSPNNIQMEDREYQNKDNYILRNNMEPKHFSKLKYCRTCQIYKPPRTSHCKQCNNCIEVFDHHCPFINNCIGKRNYRYFIGFLMSAVLFGICTLCGFLILILETAIQTNDLPSYSVKNSTVLIFIILLIGVPTILITIGFCSLFFLQFLKARRLNSNTSNENSNPIDQNYYDLHRSYSVNWCTQDASLFCPTQKLTEEQLMKYKSLMEIINTYEEKDNRHMQYHTNNNNIVLPSNNQLILYD